MSRRSCPPDARRDPVCDERAERGRFRRLQTAGRVRERPGQDLYRGLYEPTPRLGSRPCPHAARTSPAPPLGPRPGRRRPRPQPRPALGADAGLVEAAAWLHDIGYLPGLAATGLHGLDGARYLRDVQHADPLLCRLVAHHSCAIIEAEERGLAGLLRREFDPPPQPLADALTFCDMTTSPDGEHVQVDHRLAEIHDRYGPGHLVSRSIRRATPLILEAVGQVSARAAAILTGSPLLSRGTARPRPRGSGRRAAASSGPSGSCRGPRAVPTGRRCSPR